MSWAIERLARASFTCNDKTNAWQVRVTNVQVIGPDKVTPWPHYDVTWGLLDPSGVVSTGGGTFTIMQNVVNGLFSGSMLGTGMDANGGINAGACATGAEFFLYGPGNDLTLCSPIGPCYLEFGSSGGPSGLKLT